MTLHDERRALLATLLLGAAMPALAQARTVWPERPITLVVPFGPGGIADLTAVSIDAIVNERHLEFLGEGKRYWDLVRTGKAATTLVPDEEGIAALETSEKRKFSEAEIEARLRADVKKQVSALADYKHPRRVQIRWEEFNKTSTGKIKRYLYAMGEAPAD